MTAINKQPGRHEIEELLPWYAMGTLSGRDAERYSEPLLLRGIEIVCPPVDWEDWFEERRFHYGGHAIGSGVDRFWQGAAEA